MSKGKSKRSKKKRQKNKSNNNSKSTRVLNCRQSSDKDTDEDVPQDSDGDAKEFSNQVEGCALGAAALKERYKGGSVKSDINTFKRASSISINKDTSEYFVADEKGGDKYLKKEIAELSFDCKRLGKNSNQSEDMDCCPFLFRKVSKSLDKKPGKENGRTVTEQPQASGHVKNSTQGAGNSSIIKIYGGNKEKEYLEKEPLVSTAFGAEKTCKVKLYGESKRMDFLEKEPLVSTACGAEKRHASGDNINGGHGNSHLLEYNTIKHHENKHVFGADGVDIGANLQNEDMECEFEIDDTAMSYQNYLVTEDEDTQVAMILQENESGHDVQPNVGELYLIYDYSEKEWRGDTHKAKIMRQGYTELMNQTGYEYLRIIRGDNYCAIRAALYQALSLGVDVLAEWRLDSPESLCQRMMKQNNHWIQNWSFGNRGIELINNSVLDTLQYCLIDLWKMVDQAISCITDIPRFAMVTEAFNRQDNFDVKLFEAVKFLMLLESINLYTNIQEEKDVPTFACLLFARDSSLDPEAFMTKHINTVGDSGGLDQIEMCLLASTLGIVLKVARLSSVTQQDFIVRYPDDVEDITELWLVAEDDRHYNVLTEKLDRR